MKRLRLAALAAMAVIGLLLMTQPVQAQLRALNLNARANLAQARFGGGLSLGLHSNLGFNQNIVLQSQLQQLNTYNTLNTVSQLRQLQQLQQLQQIQSLNTVGYGNSLGLNSSFAIQQQPLFLNSGFRQPVFLRSSFGGGFGGGSLLLNSGFRQPAFFSQRVFAPPLLFNRGFSLGLNVPIGRSNLFLRSRF